ncbi:hypothetical protein BDA99DRAFT_182300 [Phascolomyces articulosus]|uniref:Uncharacterized protein n=1 Tax=Phascolomyces articulosus TaxID=60185 RepID=A0AAD5JS24_9FUNG|nr:hypothetical protein BDA99DRAFT_182300 [Phascolomyces articulosus]
MFSQKGLQQFHRHVSKAYTAKCFSRSLSTYDGRNKLSTMFTTLTKEQTAEDSAATTSHGLLLKGGFIRQSSSGIYSMLPLGLRTLEKIETIIDQELKSIGK